MLFFRVLSSSHFALSILFSLTGFVPLSLFSSLGFVSWSSISFSSSTFLLGLMIFASWDEIYLLLMGEKDAIIVKLFTKKSHHGNLRVIYIVQNLFQQSKEHHTISLHASYLCLTKNVRDESENIHLAKQLYPNNTKFFQQAYQLATKELHSYLFVDLTPNTTINCL